MRNNAEMYQVPTRGVWLCCPGYTRCDPRARRRAAQAGPATAGEPPYECETVSALTARMDPAEG
jgi:hypothetical protein